MTPSEDAPKTRRWIKALLVLSLALNLAIVGAVAGWVFSAGGERPDRVTRDASRFVGAQFFRALEPDDRRALVRDIARQRDRLRENRTELRDRIDRLLVELAAEPFDTEAVKEILGEQRASVTSRHQFGEELLLARLAAMSLEERQRFAQRLSESLPKRGGRN